MKDHKDAIYLEGTKFRLETQHFKLIEVANPANAIKMSNFYYDGSYSFNYDAAIKHSVFDDALGDGISMQRISSLYELDKAGLSTMLQLDLNNLSSGELGIIRKDEKKLMMRIVGKKPELLIYIESQALVYTINLEGRKFIPKNKEFPAIGFDQFRNNDDGNWMVSVFNRSTGKCSDPVKPVENERDNVIVKIWPIRYIDPVGAAMLNNQSPGKAHLKNHQLLRYKAESEIYSKRAIGALFRNTPLSALRAKKTNRIRL